MYYNFEPRSRDWYDTDETELATESSSLADTFGGLVLMIVFMFLVPVIICGLILWAVWTEWLKPKSA